MKCLIIKPKFFSKIAKADNAFDLVKFVSESIVLESAVGIKKTGDLITVEYDKNNFVELKFIGVSYGEVFELLQYRFECLVLK